VTQRLRLIPPGHFMMGSPKSETGRFENEGPRRRVAIQQAFWLFDTPCTQALWQVVMGDNPSDFKSPERPVEKVSFEDVQRFLARVNDFVPGLELVLPSEARWEFACRAGTGGATYAGPLQILGIHNAPILDRIAWYGGNSGIRFELKNGVDTSTWPEKQSNRNKAGTHPVKKKDPNAWGLYDMLGNVWEWCKDPWSGGQDQNELDGESAVLVPYTGAGNVIRGGAWNTPARAVRAASRRGNALGFSAIDLGFRCARGLD